MNSPRPDPLTLVRAYYAGLFDGEGCVGVAIQSVRGSQQLNARLDIGNTVTEPLERALELFGGRLRQVKSARLQEMWTWTVHGPDSERFAELIIPYSMIKREQLVLYLELRATVTRRGGTAAYPREVWDARRELVAMIRAEKRNGLPPTLEVVA